MLIASLNYRKWLGTGALLVVALTSRHLALRSNWLGVPYVAFFVGWLWLPPRFRTWRNSLMLGGLAALGLVLAARLPGTQPLAVVLLYPCAVFLASRAPSGPSAWIGLAGLAASSILISPHLTAHLGGNLVVLGGVYIGTYGAKLRREARQLDRERVKELENAYAELQSTHQKLIETTAQVAESRAREERLQLAADIHDGVGHRLTSLIIGLEAVELMLPHDVNRAEERLPALVTTARQSLFEVRQAVHAREQGKDLGMDAFQALVNDAATEGQWDPSVNWSGNPEHWPATVRLTLFRVLQESLTNILRYAKARHVTVDVVENETTVTMRIADDGALRQAPVGGFGLNHLKSRCRTLGGSFTWTAAKPHGLIITAQIPFGGPTHE